MNRNSRRTLTPIGIAILVVIVLLSCLLVGLVSYKITYSLKESKANKGSEPQDAAPADPSAGNPTTTNPTNDPTPSDPESGEPSGTDQLPNNPPKADRFEAVSEIVGYVDALGIDFDNLAAFDMDACLQTYFPEVVLKPTADAGVAYQNETVYIGDSLVLHMGSRSSHPSNMVYAAGGINPEGACNQKLAKLQNGTEATFAEAMAELKPKRIVITIGTNSMVMDTSLYLQFYSMFIEQLKAASPQTEIILQTAPPLSAEYEANMRLLTNRNLNRANLMVAGLASYHGLYFLSTADDLKNAGGTLDASYDNGDGYHITASAYDVWTNALRTHATTLQ